MYGVVVDSDAAHPRRDGVLVAAMETFAREGYRATSMGAVAREARISRQGLYFLFSSKEALFREAASFVLAVDLRAVEELLATDRPLAERLAAAFDRWAGRYVGPLARDVPSVVADNRELLNPEAADAPAQFEALLLSALSGHVADPPAVALTLGSVSVGLKHQVVTREAYRKRLRVAVGLVLAGANAGNPARAVANGVRSRR